MIIQIDRNIYPDSCISKVVYWLSEKYTIDRHLDGNNEVITIDGVEIPYDTLERENGVVEYTVNGVTYPTVTDANGKYVVTVAAGDVKDGVNTVVVTAENDTFIAAAISDSFDAIRFNSSIIIGSISDVVVGDDVVVSGKLVDQAGVGIVGAKLNVTVGSQTKEVTTVADGIYTTSFATSVVKVEEVKVEYLGNVSISGDKNSTVFNIVKDVGTISITLPETANASVPVDITGSVSGAAEGLPVNVTVNGVVYETVTDVDGNFVVTVDASDVKDGSNVVVVVAENASFVADAVNGSFDAGMIDTVISVEDINVTTVGAKVNVTGVLRDAGGNVIVGASVTVVMGENSISLTTNDNGNYNTTFDATTVGVELVTVEFYGNASYNGSMASTLVNVTKVVGIVAVDVPVDAVAGVSVDITGTVEGAAEGLPVNVTVNGVVYETVTGADGNFKVTVNAGDVKEGKNVVNVVAQNDTFTAITNGEFDTTIYDTVLTLENVNATIIGGKVNVTGVLKDSEGSPIVGATVVVSMGSQSESVTTDANGIYNTTFDAIHVGTQLVTVEYPGNASTNPAFVSAMVDIKAEQGTLIVDALDDVVPGEDINVTGTVTDSEGNPVVGVAVNVTVNGETFTTITDENGVYYRHLVIEDVFIFER